MTTRAICLAAAIAGGLSIADAWAAPCESVTQYFDWACGYEPRQGWVWQKVGVGTLTCGCTQCSLEGLQTTCWIYAQEETCGTMCDGVEPEHCPLPQPDPAECSGHTPPPDREGWVLHDGREGTYTPDDRYSYNSTGAGNEVSQVGPGPGRFVVRFPGLGGLDGNVQVVAHGPSNNRCKVEGWTGMPDLEVVVHCHGPASPWEVVNTPFLAYFFATNDGATSAREIGHARYDWPPHPYEPPDPAFQWNSNRPQLPKTVRQGTGDYLVRFQNLMQPDGAAVVTSLGVGLSFCQVVSTSIYNVATQSGTEVRVWCFNKFGQLEDSSFVLRYEWQRVSGTSPREGYAFASQPSTASYTPSSQFNGTGASNTAARSGTGTYRLTYPNLPPPELMPVTAYRSSTVLMSARTWLPSYCKVSSWGGPGSDTTVNGRCFTHLGALVDRAYQQVYLTRSHTPPAQP